jgi:N-acetylmuramoyl-L-alanine amidase
MIEMTRKWVVAISAGHSEDNPGAFNHILGLEEHNEANKIVFLFRDIVCEEWEVIIPSGSLEEKAEFINEYSPDIAIDLHFNSFKDPKVGGTEVLYEKSDKSGKLLAQHIQDSLLYHLGLRDRKIKACVYRDGKVVEKWKFLSLIYRPSVIVEPLFLSNAKEAELLLNLNFRIKIAFALKEGIANYFGASV